MLRLLDRDVNRKNHPYSMKGLTRMSTNVPRPFDDSDLEAKANPQERNLLLACPFDGKHHTLCTSVTEPTRNENSPDTRFNNDIYVSGSGILCIYDFTPGVVIKCGVGFLPTRFKV